MIIRKDKFKELRIARDRMIISNVLPIGAKVLFIHGYRPRNKASLGKVGTVNGYSFAGKFMNVQFEDGLECYEELIPISEVLDHVKLIEYNGGEK